MLILGDLVCLLFDSVCVGVSGLGCGAQIPQKSSGNSQIDLFIESGLTTRTIRDDNTQLGWSLVI